MGAIKRKRRDKITIRYNTKRIGVFRKIITVYSNANNSVVKLQIKGKVLPQKIDNN